MAVHPPHKIILPTGIQEHVAFCTVRRTFFKDESLGGMGTKKSEYLAFLVPKSGGKIDNAHKSSFFSFAITLEDAPEGLFKEGTTFVQYNLNSTSQFAMLRFRQGKDGGIQKADIINSNLVSGKHFPDSLLRLLCFEVGQDLSSQGIAVVGGVSLLGENQGRAIDSDAQIRLVSAARAGFLNGIQLIEESIFSK